MEAVARLLIKFPTRNRPDKFKRTLTRYRDLLSGRHEIRFVVTCDFTDFRMNNPAMRAWLRDFGKSVDLSCHFGWSWTKIQAVNADLERETADVLLLASDDMNPQLEGYDDLIVQAFARHFPDYRGAIKFHDGFRDDDLMTYPVLGWPLYQAFGYIYHPGYLSLFSDNEQTDSCKELNCLAIEPACLIRHEWTPDHFDLLHRRNESGRMYRRDGALYERRRRASFDVALVRSRLSASASSSTRG